MYIHTHTHTHLERGAGLHLPAAAAMPLHPAAPLQSRPPLDVDALAI